MTQVHFLEAGAVVRVPRGATILEAARTVGLALESPCNQTGVCGKCRVRLTPASLAHIRQPQQSVLAGEKQAEGWVLACHTELTGDVEVCELPEAARDSGAVLQHGHSAEFLHQPVITKHFHAAAEVTLVYAGGELIGREAGDTSASLFGVAVDIGTTTLVASLVDLMSGAELATASAHNPQAVYAQDVLSRISFAGRDDGLAILQGTLRTAINGMLQQLCQETGIGPGAIYELVFSGNTCMLHLATGTDPKSLGQYPYTPLIRGHQSLSAAELGLAASPLARVYLPPVLSAYVGADITSGILSLRMHELQGVSLLIDIGTNGEIVLADNGRLTATSTAAGPALEGMNISCGMCAGPGAIDMVEAAGEGELRYTTIGATLARGLCGSGLIDLVATLLTLGIIEPNGRFAEPEKVHEQLAPLLVRRDGRRVFQLGGEVSLSQKDVRQVQLAKGAIRAGIDKLLEHTGIAPAAVDRVLIAGAFGFHLSTASLVILKILPPEFADRVAYVGNTSKTGARVFLTNGPSRQEMAELAGRVRILELSGQEDFERHFVRCLSF